MAEIEMEGSESEDATQMSPLIYITPHPNSIFRAPAHMRYSTAAVFEPRLVSIGPYYHGAENLGPMEALKKSCMSELLRKGQTREIDELPLHEELQRSENELRKFFKDDFYIPHDGFIYMLLMESFFIIRIVLFFSQEVEESRALRGVDIKEVRSDLLLLENQIPLLVIRRVYQWLIDRMKPPTFPPFHIALEPFLFLDMPWAFNHEAMASLEAAHLLELYWRCSLPSTIAIPKQILSVVEQPTWADMQVSINAPKTMHNATELHETAGIRFKKATAVIFSNGIMRMPRLKIDPCQTRLLVNLIALENSKLPNLRFVSCYVKLMDALIDSEKDVELLQQYGVIFNTLSSHEAAATFFNDIGNLCVVDNGKHAFSKLYEDVQRYYESITNQRLASLKQNYINSPWAVISLGAGGTLLILTVIQTFYTVFAYYHPR